MVSQCEANAPNTAPSRTITPGRSISYLALNVLFELLLACPVIGVSWTMFPLRSIWTMKYAGEPLVMMLANM